MAGDTDERALITYEHELNDCIIRGDLDALERILADEYVLIVPDMPPGRFNRDQYITVAQTVAARSYRYSDFLIRRYGEVAVVSAQYEQEASYGGVERSGRFVITDVWVQRDGRWQLTLRHSTRVASG